MNFAWLKVSTLGIAALVGLLLGYVLFGRDHPPQIGAPTQAHLDSLEADRARFEATQKVAHDSIVAFRDSLAVVVPRVARLTAATRASHHRADSLAALAARVDTVPNDSAAVYYRAAYAERSRETDSLTVANTLLLDVSRQAQAFANLCLKTQKDAEGRMSQMQGVNDDLVAAIKASHAPSRLSLGIGAGYGAMLTGGQVRTGPTVSLQLNYAIHLPHIPGT